MSDQAVFSGWLIAWLCCLAFVLWGQRREGAGAGLVISYVLQLWVIHWLAASIYALPWYGPATPPLSAGLEESTYAIAGFAVGSTILVPLFLRKQSPLFGQDWTRTIADPWLVRTYLAIGIVTYLVLEPLLHPIPTIGAVASATSNLLLIALGMECWNGLVYSGSTKRSFWRWIAMCACLPFMTIVTKGFLGYGFAAMLTVFSFVASFYRPRWKIVAWSIAIGYLAMSMYVTYMRDRREIRVVVWGQEAYSARVSTMRKTFTEFEFLDLRNPDHLLRIDERLNQNFLIGMAVEHLKFNPEFAYGRTLWEAVQSAIPRALWRDKPIVAGSGDLVSEFTGIRFDRDTSVGIGHVMEWYVNFGSEGVFLGMILMGLVIGWIDRMAVARLYHSDWPKFSLWWLPGLSLLQVGGSLVDAVSSAAAAFVVAVLLLQLRPARRSRYPSLPSPVALVPPIARSQTAAIGRDAFE